MAAAGFRDEPNLIDVVRADGSVGVWVVDAHAVEATRSYRSYVPLAVRIKAALDGSESRGPKSDILFFVPTKPPLTRLT